MFVSGKPERSMCLERLVLELHDALNLSLVDRVIWKSNKCPGPSQWAFVNRYMLRSGFEYAFCFTNDPGSLQWDNREVLQDQSDEYLRWCQQGGQTQDWSNSSYRKKKGSFAGTTQKKSKIPTNVLEMGTHDKGSRQVKAFARQNGLPEHCATFPSKFAEFFIRWMTKKGDVVADVFGGWLTTAAVAERLERQWWISEMFLEFILAGSSRFDSLLTANIASGFCRDERERNNA
jgi:site-specific DNA-methyltransferase (cytosine-N4-specific)